jgi:hypothetical protein
MTKAALHIARRYVGPLVAGAYGGFQKVAIHPGNRFQPDLFRADGFALADIGATTK